MEDLKPYTAPCSLLTAKYLGCKDRLITAGNSSSYASIKVLFADYINGVDGKRSLREVESLQIGGGVGGPDEEKTSCTALELCGIPRMGKTIAAVATINRNSYEGSISLYDLNSTVDSASLTPFNAGCRMTKQPIVSAYTSLSFDRDSELLASSTETGEVIVWDIMTGTEVARQRVDATGVTKVQFTRSGQLLTVGSSLDSQINLWDVRASNTHSQQQWNPSSSNSDTARYALFINEKLKKHRSSAEFAPSNGILQYSSVFYHPYQDKIIAGSHIGSVVIWDLRSSASIEFQPHNSTGTTAVSLLLSCV